MKYMISFLILVAGLSVFIIFPYIIGKFVCNKLKIEPKYYNTKAEIALDRWAFGFIFIAIMIVIILISYLVKINIF